MVRQPLAFLSGNGPRLAWGVSRLFVDTPNPWKGRLGSLASSLVILKSKKDSLLAVLLLFERKTVPHPHFEVAVYQSYCKRTFRCTTLWRCAKSIGLLAVVQLFNTLQMYKLILTCQIAIDIFSIFAKKMSWNNFSVSVMHFEILKSRQI